MYLQRFIQLLAILLLGSAAHASPSSPDVMQRKDHHVLAVKVDASCDISDNLLSCASSSFSVDVRNAKHLRTKFMAPGAFTLPAAKIAGDNAGRSFGSFAEPLPDSGADLLPPFYYVFLFRLTLF